MGNRNSAYVGTTSTDTLEETMRLMTLSLEDRIQEAVREAKQELQGAMEKRLGALAERLEQRLAAVEATQTSVVPHVANEEGLEGRLRQLELFVSRMIEVEAPKVDALLHQLQNGRLPESVAAISNSPTERQTPRDTSSTSPSTTPAPVTTAAQHRLSLGEELLVAAKEKTAQEVQSLLDQGADVNFQNNLGQTALYAAASNGHSGITSVLINARATVDNRDYEGKTPLHDAAFNGNLVAIQALIGAGASVNTADGAGRTPLHLAALFGNREVLQLLIDNGADVNAKNEDKRTPLHRAAFNGNDEAVRFLILSGASKTVCDKLGKTPYDYATDYSIKNILHFNRPEVRRLRFRFHEIE